MNRVPHPLVWDEDASIAQFLDRQIIEAGCPAETPVVPRFGPLPLNPIADRRCGPQRVLRVIAALGASARG